MRRNNNMKKMTITTAKYLAELFHEGQTRADKVTPYIEHPKLVAELVEKFGGSDDYICVAWLHDIWEESLEKFCDYFKIEKKNAIYRMGMFRFLKDKEEWCGIRFPLMNMSDHWYDDQEKIKKRGKVAYLSDLLIHSTPELVLVKLCDMLANIMESNGSRMSQETRYYKSVQCLKMAERKDLDERHEEVIAAIEAYYNIHCSK